MGSAFSSARSAACRLATLLCWQTCLHWPPGIMPHATPGQRSRSLRRPAAGRSCRRSSEHQLRPACACASCHGWFLPRSLSSVCRQKLQARVKELEKAKKAFIEVRFWQPYSLILPVCSVLRGAPPLCGPLRSCGSARLWHGQCTSAHFFAHMPPSTCLHPCALQAERKKREAAAREAGKEAKVGGARCTP